MSIFGYPIDWLVHTGTLGQIHRTSAIREILRQWTHYGVNIVIKPFVTPRPNVMSISGYPMDSWVHTGTLVFLSLRAREYTGGDLREKAYESGLITILDQAERHSELPRPNGWCPFSGTLWTHEHQQVLCVTPESIGQNGASEGRGNLTCNSVTS